MEITKSVTLDVATPKFVRNIYRTPETLADFVAAGILQALISPILIKPPMTKWDADIDYGIESARRDLQIKARGERR
ncbi:MAG: hypothetical protein WBW99_13630 [Pseudolabrys sp.]